MGFHLKFGNDCCVREGGRLFQSPSWHFGLSGMGRGSPGARVWNSLWWTGVYGVRKVWLVKMPWPGIKFTDFSRVLGKLIKFLDFSRAGKHFFVFPGLFPNSRTAGNHAVSSLQKQRNPSDDRATEDAPGPCPQSIKGWNHKTYMELCLSLNHRYWALTLSHLTYLFKTWNVISLHNWDVSPFLTDTIWGSTLAQAMACCSHNLYRTFLMLKII